MRVDASSGRIDQTILRDFRYGNAEEANKLQNYFSFRIMDDIYAAINGYKLNQVIKLVATPTPQSSDSVFFCICLETDVIAIQFNNDINFIKALRIGTLILQA
ncbi:conserved hypothetical protein [Xanthomonas phaseoli pv. phaseoli]|uniref:Uncharacterized protein n=1 Tax=Xanthomonas campestris pv. phaseoli TaxID=317013 RepID=A0ABY1TMY4_XANCH|nr:conserved hypothetical protein [Xanthomonas phaseoli pv. phaseoli]